jgi:outer membrane protein assembly factor BamB
MIQLRLLTVVLPILLAAHLNSHGQTPTIHWPSFRGLHASGVAEGFKTPDKWTEFKWSTAVPGLGHSSPVIWGDRIFVTTAVTATGDETLKIGLYGSIQPVKENAVYSWQLYCLNKTDGSLVWKRTAHEGIPRIKRHPKASHASSTPATDGKHIISFFGAEGLFCHNFEGELLWRKDFGTLDSGYFAAPEAQWGFGSSAVIHSNLVLIQCDVQTNSFIAALDLRDGKELWRTPRQDVPTWSTPTVAIHGDRAQVIANGFKHVGGYDLLTGKELWKLGGAGDIPVPTPVVAHNLIFVTSAHGRLSPVYAIRADASGDITLEAGASTNRFIPWSVSRGGNYMQTPIVVGDYLYTCRDNGVVTCYTAKTGEKQFSERLGSGSTGFTASPVSADGKIYYPSEEGDVYVLRATPQFQVVSTNALNESCMATPAISEGALYFRTRGHVVAVK